MATNLCALLCAAFVVACGAPEQRISTQEPTPASELTPAAACVAVDPRLAPPQLERLGTAAGREIRATPGALACSEPGPGGAVECEFTGPGFAVAGDAVFQLGAGRTATFRVDANGATCT